MTGIVSPNQARPTGRRGFTLVEILIVVLVLSILATIVLPQITAASEKSRLNTLKTNLIQMRKQIAVYKQQHGQWPKLDKFARQLTKPTDLEGNIVKRHSDDHYYGPYIIQIPDNPYTGDNEVDQAKPGQSDWYYNPDTGAFKANDSQAHRDL